MSFEVTVPDGASGDWKIETFTVSRDRAALFNLGSRGRAAISPGTYKRLTISGSVMMSNTPFEYMTNRWIIARAKGRVLINGLGLGAVLTAILKKPEVTEVWVVEKEQDVINLVWPAFAHDPRCKLIHADALDYRPPKGVRFDVVWHDIWISVCTDNLDDMKKLHRRYGRLCNEQASWGRDLIEDDLRRERRSGWRW